MACEVRVGYLRTSKLGKVMKCEHGRISRINFTSSIHSSGQLFKLLSRLSFGYIFFESLVSVASIFIEVPLLGSFYCSVMGVSSAAGSLVHDKSTTVRVFCT